MIRFGVALTGVLLLFLTACTATRQGPGATCTETRAEAKIPEVGEGVGQAAAAEGGQDAANAPLAYDLARVQPRTQITRGQGSITSSSSDSEEREVASGGAQNVALTAPTTASNGVRGAGGGTALAIRAEYAKTLETLRAELQMVRTDPELTPEQKGEQARLIREDIRAAQTDLALALSHVGRVETHNNMNGDNVLFGVSSSSTDGKPDAKAADTLGDRITELAAQRGDADPDAAPAGADDPEDAPEGR